MKLRLNLIALAALAFCGGGMARAQVVGGLQSCGVHSVTGAFAFLNRGTLPDKSNALFVGVMVFDGVGGVYASNTGNAGGVVFRDGGSKVSYTLNRDCTGTLTFVFPQGTVHWDIVVADSGKRILGIMTDPGPAFSMEAYRQ